MKQISADKNIKYAALVIILAGIFVRYWFYFGQVFSDDAYYNYSAYTMYKGDFGADFIGYPICLIRIGQSWLTALSYWIFGTNEFATTSFPFIFSILNMCLAFKITKLITKADIYAIIVLLFTAFYPTEVLFASIGFTDMFSTVFINLGILLLLLADKDNKKSLAVLSGTSFFISVLFKINVFYTALLLIGFMIFLFIKKKSLNIYILLSLITLSAGMMIEGLVYFIMDGDFFYRLTIMNESYEFSKNDFFTQGSAQGYSEKDYWSSLFRLLIIDNPKAVFLRRSMVFIPFFALIQFFLNIKQRKNRIVVYWFFGLLFLYLFFTTSFSSYTPLTIRFTWYLYPLFLPSMIMAAMLFSKFKKPYLILSLAGYIIYSVYMTSHFRDYFDTGNIWAFSEFVRQDTDRIIYTDHFTKYSIDLIYEFKEPSRVISLKDTPLDSIPKGSIVVYHTGHISEINKRGFDYPVLEDFGEHFEILRTFGSIAVLEKK